MDTHADWSRFVAQADADPEGVAARMDADHAWMVAQAILGLDRTLIVAAAAEIEALADKLVRLTEAKDD